MRCYKLDKLKLAFYWAASCGGCEIAVLDIDEKILDLVYLLTQHLVRKKGGLQEIFPVIQGEIGGVSGG